MGLIACKNKCRSFEQESKQSTYENGGCYCKNCDYYFKKRFLRCPCCNTRVRYSARSNKKRQESLAILVDGIETPYEMKDDVLRIDVNNTTRVEIIGLSKGDYPKFEIQELDYHVKPNEPVHITIEKTGYHMCDGWNAKIINLSNNSTAWERVYRTTCVMTDIMTPQKFYYNIHNQNSPIILSDIGNYIFQINIGDKTLEKDFIVRENVAGTATMDS